jgi:hypothetical protein
MRDLLISRLFIFCLEMHRKSRNRIHAKQTRDRKKLLTSGMQKLILSLEHHNKLMRSKLSAVILRGEPTLDQVSIHSVPAICRD